MTQIPAGWYPDPDPEAPEPKGQRYWDGQQWTEHLQPAPGGYPQPTPGAPAGAPGGYASYPAAGGYAGQAAVPTTPDGQVLSGWWRRVGAYVIDTIIINVISWIVAFPAARDYFDAVSRMSDEVLSGNQGGDLATLMGDVAAPLATIGIVAILVSLVYNVAFLRWKSATPGKMALGIEIRLRETPGQLPFGTILARWGVQNINRVLGFLPYLGFFGSLFWLLDSLWPLWDTKRQAIHDKVAKTNVVRR